MSTTATITEALFAIVESERERADAIHPGLALIPVKLNRRTTRALGRAIFRLGACVAIDLSAKQWLAEEAYTHPQWEAKIREVLRHEYAHAVAGIRAGHGPIWRMHARRLGAPPRATTAIPWTYIDRERKLWRVACTRCGENLGLVEAKVRPTRKLRGKVSQCCHVDFDISEVS